MEDIKYGVVGPNKELKELYMFEIKGLFEQLMKVAIENDEEYKRVYEEKYAGKYNCFSEAIEFCLHELGWMIYNPFANGKKDVLFSNGENTYVTTLERVQEEGFDRLSITAPGMPRLTDENVSYDKTLTKLETYDDGIVTEKGYVSATPFREDLNILTRMMLLHEMAGNEKLYNHFLENRPKYTSALDYFTSFPNVIAVDKLENGQYLVRFVSENDGRVLDFINGLIISGNMANYDPMIVEEQPSSLKM